MNLRKLRLLGTLLLNTYINNKKATNGVAFFELKSLRFTVLIVDDLNSRVKNKCFAWGNGAVN